MPTIEEDRKNWGHSYSWAEGGDEWSSEWGGTDYLWYGTIFPRIQAFLPSGTVLEIAPGYGRCTQYLLSLCREMIAVDLAPNCISACQKRFQGCPHITYFVNDGRSLDMIPDDSLDFVFSWDSLVHAESDVLASYLEYLAVKLKQGCYGFIHHSNIGSFKNLVTGKLMVPNPHWRATSMTAALFREYCSKAGLICISQELVVWGGDALTDCFSLFARESRIPGHNTVIAENRDFMLEAWRMKKIAELFRPAAIK